MSAKPCRIKFFEVASVSSNKLCGLLGEWNSSWLACSSRNVCVLSIKNESAKDLYANLCMIDNKGLPETHSCHTVSKSMLCPRSQPSPRTELFYKFQKSTASFFFHALVLCFVLHIKMKLPYNDANLRFLVKFFSPFFSYFIGRITSDFDGFYITALIFFHLHKSGWNPSLWTFTSIYRISQLKISFEVHGNIAYYIWLETSKELLFCEISCDISLCIRKIMGLGY